VHLHSDSCRFALWLTDVVTWCLQDDMFGAYAKECLHEYASQGKTTVPMQILLNKRPGMEVLV
jgi:hypothetical protein